VPPTDPTPEYDRHIPLEGAVNFRDLGGYPTADGRTIRWRTLFRADGLSRLTSPDRATIRQLGIATVIDLRTSAELERGRFPVEEIPVGFHHLPLLNDVGDPQEFDLTPGMLAAQYREMVGQAAPEIARVLGIVAERRAHPVIVHCTAGKDRTGVLVAVLLGLLGVDDDVIVQDYALSAGAMVALRQKLIERYPEGRTIIENANEVFSAAPSNISELLAHLRDRYGSIDDYAASAGVGPDVVNALRDVLLE
jgi:protein-tyrosine phosphatase